MVYLITILLLSLHSDGTQLEPLNCSYVSQTRENIAPLRGRYYSFIGAPFHEPKLPVNLPDALKRFENFSCGSARLERVHFIVSGSTAPKGAWPWQVYMEVTSHACGGTLISKSWIVSAAHCFTKGLPVSYLGLGVWDIVDGKTEPGVQVREVDTIIVHEHFNDTFASNDIALIKLGIPLEVTDYVQPICLSKEGIDYKDFLECYITGWGIVNFTTKIRSPKLQQAKVNIMDQSLCAISLIASGITFDSRQLCLDLSEKSTCHGDSGGPLVCKVDDRFHLTGVISYSSKVLRKQFLNAVLTRVSEFVDWIMLTIENNT